MVLDGPLDYGLPRLEYDYAQAQGFMHALDSFLTWCSQTGCALTRAGDPHTVLDQLIARVGQQPLPASYTVNGVTRRARSRRRCSSRRCWRCSTTRRAVGRRSPTRCSGAVQSGQGSSLLAIADQYLGRRTDGTWTPLVESNAVISCVDRPATTHPTATQELADVATFQAQLPPWGGSWGTTPCIGMPKPAKGDKLGDVRVTGAPPILVVGTTGDPATPYAGAQAIVGRIAGSDLLTFDSTEHTAYGSGRSTCIDDAVDAYLVDGRLPPAGTRCAPG